MIELGSDMIKTFTPKRGMASRYFRNIWRKRKIKKIYEK
jgi:hypothetical protein